jgi:hypothetical protein
MDVVLHVRIFVAGVVINAFGALIFWVINCVEVAVQPFAAVTVTVYVPGAVTESDDVELKTPEAFDQEYVLPPVAFNEMDCVVQFRIDVVGTVILAVGAVMF